MTETVENFDRDVGYLNHLSLEEIEACEDHDDLRRWLRDAGHLMDSVISQVETNQITGVRDAEWEKRVSVVLTCTKKRIRTIKRQAAAVGCDLPVEYRKAGDPQIEKYRKMAFESRSFERQRIIDWIEKNPGNDAAHIIAGITSLEHHRSL